MNLNANSFFFRRYLGYGRTSTYENRHPESVCDLVWRFFKRTALYLFVLDVLASTVFTTITMGLVADWPRDELGKMVYFGSHTGWPLDLLIGIPGLAGQAVIGIAIILAIVFGLVIGVLSLLDWIGERLPNSVVQGVSDVTNSIRGKSCAKVTINNLDPEYNDHD